MYAQSYIDKAFPTCKSPSLGQVHIYFKPLQFFLQYRIPVYTQSVYSSVLFQTQIYLIHWQSFTLPLPILCKKQGMSMIHREIYNFHSKVPLFVSHQLLTRYIERLPKIAGQKVSFPTCLKASDQRLLTKISSRQGRDTATFVTSHRPPVANPQVKVAACILAKV